MNFNVFSNDIINSTPLLILKTVVCPIKTIRTYDSFSRLATTHVYITACKALLYRGQDTSLYMTTMVRGESCTVKYPGLDMLIAMIFIVYRWHFYKKGFFCNCLLSLVL